MNTIEADLSTKANMVELDYANHTYISDNSDMNNYLTVGRYTIPSDALAKTCTNLPILASGSLYVINALGGDKTLEKIGYKYFLQLYLAYHGVLYIRTLHCNDGNLSYGDWWSFNTTIV